MGTATSMATFKRNNTTYNKYSTRSTSNIHYTTRCGVMGLSPYYKHYKHYKHY